MTTPAELDERFVPHDCPVALARLRRQCRRPARRGERHRAAQPARAALPRHRPRPARPRARLRHRHARGPRRRARDPPRAARARARRPGRARSRRGAARDRAVGPAPPAAAPEEAPAPWRRGLARHTRRRDADAITHHYDLSNRFYERVLGPSMVYSCAVFPTAETSLDEAQAEKVDLVCRKSTCGPGSGCWTSVRGGGRSSITPPSTTA